MLLQFKYQFVFCPFTSVECEHGVKMDKNLQFDKYVLNMQHQYIDIDMQISDTVHRSRSNSFILHEHCFSGWISRASHLIFKSKDKLKSKTNQMDTLEKSRLFANTSSRAVLILKEVFVSSTIQPIDYSLYHILSNISFNILIYCRTQYVLFIRE